MLFARYRADGPVVAQTESDQTVKAFMAMIALFLLIDIGWKLYRQAGQIREARLRDALTRSSRAALLLVLRTAPDP